VWRFPSAHSKHPSFTFRRRFSPCLLSLCLCSRSCNISAIATGSHIAAPRCRCMLYVPHWRVTSAPPPSYPIDIFRASSPHGTPIRFFFPSFPCRPPSCRSPSLFSLPAPLLSGDTFPGAPVSSFPRYPVPHRQFLSRLYIGYVGVPCLLVVSPPRPSPRALATP